MNKNPDLEPQSNDSVFLRRFKLIVGNETQQKIADKVGVQRATVGYWLSGKITPSTTVIIKIANAYHVSVNWLCGLDDEDDYIMFKAGYKAGYAAGRLEVQRQMIVNYNCFLEHLLSTDRGENE